MLGSESDILPAVVETIIGFLVLSPGKRFSRVTSAYSLLPLRGAAPGSPWRRERHGTATNAVRFSLPPEEGLGEGKSTAGKSFLCYLWLQRILRSRLIFCVMPGMAQGAHRGRPVAAAPCTPGSGQQNRRYAVPSTYPLQASGRAEAASVQNTALSPHPCGLPRPSGNVSSDVEAATPAVSATMVNKLTTSRARTVGRVSRSRHPAQKAAPHPLPCPAALRLRGPAKGAN